MALFQSPLKKPKKPTTTAYDALKPASPPASTVTSAPLGTAIQQPYQSFQKPATAQTALTGGMPTPTVPESPQSPPLPGKPVVPTNTPVRADASQSPQVQAMYQEWLKTNPGKSFEEFNAQSGRASYDTVQTGTQNPPNTQNTGYMAAEQAKIKTQIDTMNNTINAMEQQYRQFLLNPNMRAQAEQLRQQINLAKKSQQQLQAKYDQYTPIGGGTADQQAQIDQFNQYVQDELKKQGIQISDPASVQNNPAYQAAIEAMKNGKNINDAAAIFRQNLPNGYNFQIGPSGYDAQKGNIGDVTQTNLPEINKGEQININGTMVNRTDLEKLLSGDNGLANTASKAALDSLMETLKNGGALTPDQLKQLTDPFNKDSMARQGTAESNALGAMSARGFGTNAAAVTGGLADIGRQYEAERTQKEADIIKQNLMAGIEGKQKATQGLSDLAKSEREARINAAEIGSKENIAQAGITSEEKQKQADLQFAQDELYQNGQLSQAGLALKQNLETYGLQLDKYKTDQGFDLEMAKQDLTQRLAQSGLDVDAAKLQADNVFKSLDTAIADKKIDSEVNTAIAQLQQQAASGDRDAQFKVDSLRVEQNLRQQGLDHDLAMFTADLAYKIQSGREKLDAEMFMFLKELDAKLKAQNQGGGLGGFLGKIVGTVIGAASGGLGTAIGSAIGGDILGGGKKEYQ